MLHLKRFITHTHTHTHTYIYIYIYIHTYIHTCIHANTDSTPPHKQDMIKVNFLKWSFSLGLRAFLLLDWLLYQG